MSLHDALLAKAFGGGNGGGGADIDVTAEVGQTIIVKEVDASGKPTKWKAADYQPRTHWSEETVILPETTVECADMDLDDDGVGDGIFGGVLPDMSLTPNAQYNVYYNGTKYSCPAILMQYDEEARAFALGNVGAITGEGNTGEPFILQIVYYPTEGYSQNLMMVLDGSTTVVLSIKEDNITPIPVQYVTNAFPYYIEVTGRGTENDPYVCNDTAAKVSAVFNSGRLMAIKAHFLSESIITIYHLLMCAPSSNGYGMGFIFSGNDGSANNVYITLHPQEDGTYAVKVGDSIGG